MRTDLQKRFKGYDFVDAKPVKEIPALEKLQAESAANAASSIVLVSMLPKTVVPQRSSVNRLRGNTKRAR